MKLKNHRIIYYFICVTMMFSNSYLYAHGEDFEVNAKAAILIDASSGRVLFEQNAHEKLPPASVTKIMTMLLAMEAIDQKTISLEDKVLISERAAKMGGSQLFMEPGEEKTVNDLLKGIAIASANDACVAIGEHIGGTEEMFVKRMNERAKELNMNDTQFLNTNGLPKEGHVTSAYDIALMSKELLKHPQIHNWLTIWMSTMKVGLPNKKQTNLQLTNTNRMIRTYPGANGIKTGFTSDAKYCLSTSAKKNGLTLVAVILGSPTSKIRFAEATKLLNYGFATYSSVPVAKKNQVMGELTVEKGKEPTVNGVAKEELNALVKKGEEAKVHKEVVLPKSIKAPFKAGEKVGQIIVTKDGQEIGRVDVVTEKAVHEASFVDIFGKIISTTGY